MKRKIESLEQLVDDFCRRELSFDELVGILRMREGLILVIGAVIGGLLTAIIYG